MFNASAWKHVEYSNDDADNYDYGDVEIDSDGHGGGDGEVIYSEGEVEYLDDDQVENIGVRRADDWAPSEETLAEIAAANADALARVRDVRIPVMFADDVLLVGTDHSDGAMAHVSQIKDGGVTVTGQAFINVKVTGVVVAHRERLAEVIKTTWPKAKIIFDDEPEAS